MQLRLYRALVQAFKPPELEKQRRAAGLCLSCGARPARQGDLACSDCAAKTIALH